ncbi:MAG TPA: hypothetical protein VJ851_01580 [Jatrophihabitans sp.]|nr:hypothetical protein [Jatrophihabitans sp.]
MSYTPRYAPRSVIGRRTGLAAILLLAVLALTGCLNVQLNATVHSDNTVSGTARVGIAKSLAALSGISNSELLNQLKTQQACDFGGKSSTSKSYDDGTYVGVDCTFSGVTLAEFNSGEDGPRLARVGDSFELSGHLNLLDALDTGGLLPSSSSTPTALPTDLGSLFPSGFPTDLGSLLPSDFPTDLGSLFPSGFPTDLNSLLPSGLPTDLSSLLPSGLPTDLGSLLPSGLPNGFDPSSLLRTAKVSFAFTFPGKVHSSTGKVHGHTVTFTPDAAGNIDFQTRADATGPSGLAAVSSPAKIGLSLVVLALIVLALALLLVRRRRSRPMAVAGQPAGYPAAGYPAAGYQQGYPGQPPYPPESQYPGQPQYPAQPGYPAQPQYPAQPAYPPQPGYPAQPQYPAPPQPYTGPPPQVYPPPVQPPPQQQPPPPSDVQP